MVTADYNYITRTHAVGNLETVNYDKVQIIILFIKNSITATVMGRRTLNVFK